MYPDDVVIYDSFVERAIAVLQCIDPVLAKLPRLGYAPKGGDNLSHEMITDYYLGYDRLVRAIYYQYKELIIQLNKAYSNGFEYPIRCIDKVLWSIGNMDQPFQLGSVLCK